MVLPMLRRCCGCLSLETGCFALCIMSILFCITYIVVGAWNLPRHRLRETEDNLISMTMIMFSTLSGISNLVVLAGMGFRRPEFLQLSILFNSFFILCLFLVAAVTCLFSSELRPHLESPIHIVAVVFLFVAGAGYSLYYLTVVNSLYRKMKESYGDTELPKQRTNRINSDF
ncbi:PREDICTED: uncharacterized protein LOC106113672 [Papilio xuthus]|uniref:Uncharacterized protein LOC106113672 n=1 Tax=Papilio xuthus TaxID=66420 RepID=A0AAJ6YZB6_PAPXU|nr:PREDICTED: uncharacterized protein LOC106113672 [Papilio xuthus]XP_013161979.1 PREDICTED: uncharacterized protein LOC106113672 [Papilio xuthus]